MTNENNNNDSTKEFKALKKALEEQDKTRVFERVSEQQTTPSRLASSNQKKQEAKTVTTEKSEEKRKASAEAEKKTSRSLAPWQKTTLKVLRIILVPLLCIIALYIGLYVGYVSFGNESPGDIWDFGTWKHLLDLIFADG